VLDLLILRRQTDGVGSCIDRFVHNLSIVFLFYGTVFKVLLRAVLYQLAFIRVDGLSN